MKGAKGRRLVQNMRDACDAYQKADEALDAHFRPLVEEALKRKNFEEAKSIAGEMGGRGVRYVFILDTIRQAEKRHGKT